MSDRRPDEFETIRRLLTPLADHPAARGLLDDVAVLGPPSGKTLVLTHDTMVEGVHFLPTDPPDTIARKLVRVNLSDLAAKGATPFGYLMSCAWNDRCDWTWREEFASGLMSDQRCYGLTLLGGDSVVTPGPMTFGATLIGWGDPGRTPSRAGANAGDAILISGTIGDGLLGLMAAQGDIEPFGDFDAGWLTDRYRLPNPRVELAGLVSREATASADVSDGLAADIANIAASSGLAAELDLAKAPVSEAGARWLTRQPDRALALGRLATGGDDYEIVFTVPQDHIAGVREEAASAGCPVSLIGRMVAGEGVSATCDGTPVDLGALGWRHR